MADQIIPLDNAPNQSMTVMVNVNGQNISLGLSFRYNEAGGFWVMGISDPSTGIAIVANVPLLCGNYPAGNILRQYGYLGIGSAWLVNMGSTQDSPDNTNLGSGFVLIWGDNG
jgi:hypothetical protein